MITCRRCEITFKGEAGKTRIAHDNSLIKGTDHVEVEIEGNILQVTHMSDGNPIRIFLYNFLDTFQTICSPHS